MKLEDQVKTIQDRDGFVAFVRALQQDLKRNPTAWNNAELASFLDALAAWTSDMDGYYKNQNMPLPERIPWQVFANILMGARLYE